MCHPFKLLSALIPGIFIPLLVVAQGINLGIPPVWNFSKKTYNAGTQNWDATQDNRGVLYWANNEGLLQYDGTNWRRYPVANKTVVRSVAFDGQARIYAGAQSELGYFSAGKNGHLIYHSLVGLLPADQRDFEDVWDIVFWEKMIFFRTNKAIFAYNGTTMAVWQQPAGNTALFATRHGLFLQTNISEISRFEQQGFQPFATIAGLQSPLTAAVDWNGDTLLFTSLKHGIFSYDGRQFSSWSTPYDGILRASRIYSATRLTNGQLALGTSLDGLMTIDQHRRIFRHLNKNSGLQNNNILSTFADHAGNLWLGLDSGIDVVVLDAPFCSVIPDGDLEGTGYSAAVAGDRLYLGVSNGVYTAPWKPFYPLQEGTLFQKIPATDGQVWALNVFDGAVLLGHHEGTFQLEGNNAVARSNKPGGWTYVRLSEQYLMGGNYAGLTLFRRSGNAWVEEHQLEGLRESCRYMVKDESGAIWVAHPYRGLYRVQWSPDDPHRIAVAFFNSRNGLPSDLNNLVFLIAGNAVFSTETGMMRFDITRGQFVEDADFKRLLGDIGRIRYLKEDQRGNIWYVSEKETGVLEVDDLGLNKTVHKKVYPELYKKLVNGFEFIYPVDRNNVLFGAEQGFIHFNALAGQHSDTSLQIVLSQITAHGIADSVLLGNSFAADQTDAFVLPSGLNNLRFAYSATDYKDPSALEYRTQLDGLDRSWTEWSGDAVRHFTNLSPGSYLFKVQVRRRDGRVSPVVTYAFSIRPPWYASGFALVMYGLVFIGLIVGYITRQKRRFETEKEQLTEQHLQLAAEQQLAVEQSRAAVDEIKNEKFEAEIRFKNQELATATMHLVQKGEILLTIQENLNQILEKSTNPVVKREIQQLLNLLNFDAKLDEDWEQFAFHFDQVHVDFLKRLREQYPQLSTSDYKLCAYLRMNLTTKEIAPLLNISVRGVEASRYRLRKKLNLPNEVNLTDVILGL